MNIKSRTMAAKLRVLAAAQGLIAKIQTREGIKATSHVISLYPQAASFDKMWNRGVAGFHSDNYDNACKQFWISVLTIEGPKMVPIDNIQRHIPPNFKPYLTAEDLFEKGHGMSTLRIPV